MEWISDNWMLFAVVICVFVLLWLFGRGGTKKDKEAS